MLTQKLTLAEERPHRLFSKASKSSSFAFPLSAQFNRLKRVANERAKQGESSATKISKNKDWMRWKSREEMSSATAESIVNTLKCLLTRVTFSLKLTLRATSASSNFKFQNQNQQLSLRHADVISADSKSTSRSYSNLLLTFLLKKSLRLNFPKLNATLKIQQEPQNLVINPKSIQLITKLNSQSSHVVVDAAGSSRISRTHFVVRFTRPSRTSPATSTPDLCALVAHRAATQACTSCTWGCQAMMCGDFAT
ncbi:hypothetical protein F511_15035 [Dorcoceras hygrometricum]|uniref:Uncharacterized protein n=1 Tax=Dorcoceras hygrometricum TaxID=472368 RepID=A0A2Z7ATD7_9LAMI|nr:hypothetical protein F511_15035 [Dorcoceras hygrometricum]